MKKNYSHKLLSVDTGRKFEDRIKRVAIKFETVNALISSIEEYSPETGGHGIRVGYYAGCIAEMFRFDKNYVREVELAGTLHDLGKLGVPSHILNKAGPLTNEEYMMIQEHPVHTSKILQNIKDFSHISKITLHHHERYDGSGYPEGLQGDSIPFESQIISVADAFDAMTSDRAYRKALSVSCAIDLLMQESGRQFKPELVSQAAQFLPEIYNQIWMKYKKPDCN